MRNVKLLIGSLILLPAIAACISQPDTPSIQTITTQIITNAPTVENTVTQQFEPADIIFNNGTIITIEKENPVVEAAAIRGKSIVAVGTNEEVMAYQGANTIIIDLQGKTLMPGFIDGHTHILAFPDRLGRSLDEAQDTALRYGFTTVNEMWANEDQVNRLLLAEEEGWLDLRVNVFPSYNDGIRGEEDGGIILNTWFPDHDPILDPTHMVRIPGIKIFVDGAGTSARGCWALSEPFEPGAPGIINGICGSSLGDLYWSQDLLNNVVLQAQTAGYRVAFHAMGDRAIDAALNAIEFALDGKSNELVRHQIEHNSLVNPEQLPRYKDLDIAVSVRGYGDFCDLQSVVPAFGPERYAWYANRYALPGLGIHAYIETDFGWTVDPDDRFSQRSLDPIMQLYGIVTHHYINENGSDCEPDPIVATYVISVERALQMLTI